MGKIIKYNSESDLNYRVKALFSPILEQKNKDKELKLNLDLEGIDEETQDTFNYFREAKANLDDNKTQLEDTQYISQKTKLESKSTREEVFQNLHNLSTKRKKIISIFKDKISKVTHSSSKTVTITQKPEKSEVRIQELQMKRVEKLKQVYKEHYHFEINTSIFEHLTLDAVIDTFHDYSKPTDAWMTMAKSYNLPNSFLE